MANLSFMDGLITEDTGHLDVGFQSIDEQVASVFNLYLKQGKSTTTLLSDAGVRLVTPETKLENIQHILFQSYQYFRGKFIETFGAIGSDPEFADMQEDFIRERMRILVADYLFNHPTLGEMSIGFIMQTYGAKANPSTHLDIADLFIETQLMMDRDTEEFRAIEDYERDFNLEAEKLIETVKLRIWNDPSEAYDYFYNSLWNYFLGEMSTVANRETIREILLGKYQDVNANTSLIEHFAIDNFLNCIGFVILKSQPDIKPKALYISIYNTIVEKFLNKNTAIINPEVVWKLIKMKYTSNVQNRENARLVTDPKEYIQHLATDIFFELQKKQQVEA